MLYELDKSDVADVLALITSPQLSVRADQVPRVAQLQAKLSTIEPESGHVLEAALDLERSRALELERQADELMRARDAALLELGLERSKVHKLEAALNSKSMHASA